MLGVACTSREVVPVVPPPLGDARTLIVASLVDDTPRVTAIDVARPQPVEIPYDADDAVVWALLYDRSIDELALTRGALPIVAKGVTLPEPDRVFETRFLEEVQSEWATRDDVPTEVRRLQFDFDPLVDPCRAAPSFDPVSFPLDTFGSGRSGVSDGAGAFTFTEDGLFHRVTASGAEPVALSTSTPSGAIVRASNGDLYLGGDGGSFVSGDLERGFAPLPSAPSGGEVRWLSASIDPAMPFEIFALGADGAIARFDGDWTTIDRGPPITSGGVAYVEPGHAVFARSSSEDLLVYEGSATRTESPDAGAMGLFAVAYVAGARFVGTAGGNVHAEVDGRWARLGGFDFASVLTIIPFEDGVMVGGEDGFLAYWTRSTGLCTLQLGSANVVAMIPVGRDLVLVQENVERDLPIELRTRPTQVTYLVRR